MGRGRGADYKLNTKDILFNSNLSPARGFSGGRDSNAKEVILRINKALETGFSSFSTLKASPLDMVPDINRRKNKDPYDKQIVEAFKNTSDYRIYKTSGPQKIFGSDFFATKTKSGADNSRPIWESMRGAGYSSFGDQPSSLSGRNSLAEKLHRIVKNNKLDSAANHQVHFSYDDLTNSSKEIVTVWPTFYNLKTKHSHVLSVALDKDKKPPPSKAMPFFQAENRQAYVPLKHLVACQESAGNKFCSWVFNADENKLLLISNRNNILAVVQLADLDYWHKTLSV